MSGLPEVDFYSLWWMTMVKCIHYNRWIIPPRYFIFNKFFELSLASTPGSTATPDVELHSALLKATMIVMGSTVSWEGYFWTAFIPGTLFGSKQQLDKYLKDVMWTSLTYQSRSCSFQLWDQRGESLLVAWPHIPHASQIDFVGYFGIVNFIKLVDDLGIVLRYSATSGNTVCAFHDFI